MIQSRDHILNTYSEGISRYAEQKFSRDNVNVIGTWLFSHLNRNAHHTQSTPASRKSSTTVLFTPCNPRMIRESLFIKMCPFQPTLCYGEFLILFTKSIVTFNRSTGIAMNPFTKRVSDLLPNQYHKKVRFNFAWK